jgi:hypothetical protein
MGSWLFSSKHCNFSSCEFGTHPGAHRLVYVRRLVHAGKEVVDDKARSLGTRLATQTTRGIMSPPCLTLICVVESASEPRKPW